MTADCFRLTAFGLVNCLGVSNAAVAGRLFAGDQSRFSRRTDFIPGREVYVGAVLEDLPEVPAALGRYASRVSRLLAAAYRQIASVVQEYAARFGSERIGVVIGSSTSGIEVGEWAIGELNRLGELPAQYRYTQQEPGAPAEFLACFAGLRGPAYTVCTACSSSAKVFGSARNLIRLGICDAVVVGGADALCRLTLNGFSALELYSDRICSPFSRERSGITIGEGSALFMLTAEEGGIQLLGVGESADAYHLSAPDPEGGGAELSMRRALADAGVPPEAVSYINLHGTGTLQNDVMEGRAVARIFPPLVPCSSTKGLIGHALGAAGALEAGFCCLALSGGDSVPLPPHCCSGGYDESIPPLNLVRPGAALPVQGRVLMLSNSFAFGGNNCSLILGREWG